MIRTYYPRAKVKNILESYSGITKNKPKDLLFVVHAGTSNVVKVGSEMESQNQT